MVNHKTKRGDLVTREDGMKGVVYRVSRDYAPISKAIWERTAKPRKRWGTLWTPGKQDDHRSQWRVYIGDGTTYTAADYAESYGCIAERYYQQVACCEVRWADGTHTVEVEAIREG